MPETLRYAGIDVAQDWLDVAIHGPGQLWRRVDKSPCAASSFGIERLNASPQLQVAGLATAKRYIDLTLGEPQVCFQMGDVTLASSTIEGEFPNYRSLIPEKATHSVVFDAAEAYRALRQLAPPSPRREATSSACAGTAAP